MKTKQTFFFWSYSFWGISRRSYFKIEKRNKTDSVNYCLNIIDDRVTSHSMILWFPEKCYAKKSDKAIYTVGMHPHLIIHPLQNTGVMFGLSWL